MRPRDLPRFYNLLISIVTLFLAETLQATNWYVRPSSFGSNAGKDWNNAWSLSSIDWARIEPGDTIWLAGGTYTSALVVRPPANGTPAAPISITRATSADSAATSSAGWNSSFDSQVVISGQAPAIDVPASSYIAIDGHQNSGSLIKNTRVYGIKVVTPPAGGSAVEAGEGYPPASGSSASVTNISFRNIDVLGPYHTQSHPATNPDYGFNLASYNNPRVNLVFHDCRVQGMCESFRENMWANPIIEYCYIADEANDGTDHEDVALYYRGSNETWRYNVIVNSPNDGIAIGPDGYGPWYFYGNIYYNSFNWFIKFDGTTGPYYIFNNIFASSAANPDFANTAPGWLQNRGNAVSGSRVYNNIFFNVANGLQVPGVASDYNAYNYTNLFGWTIPPTEAHGVTFAGNPFVDSAGGDFHLTAAAAARFAKGIAIAGDGYINYDMDGKQRGNPWYIGAYQSFTATTSRN